MPLSLSQLASPPTRSEIVTWMLTTLGELGFPVTGWQPGRIANTLLNSFATTAAFALQVSASTAANAYSSTASGAGLSLYSKSRFDNTKDTATKASGGMLLTNAGLAPFTIKVGALIARDNLGVQFTNTTGGTLAASSTLVLNFKALIAGESGNITNNSTLTLTTPLAGVALTNPGPGDVDLDGFDDPWYDTATGTDEESDSELDQRNSTKWGLLATEKTSTAYENLALAQTGVAKALIVANNPRGPGTVDVYVSGASTTISNADIILAQAAFSTYTFGTDEAWPIPVLAFGDPAQSRASLIKPSELELNITGTVSYDPQYTETEVSSKLSTALGDYVTLTPIGGWDYTPGPANVITIGDILEVMEGVEGVRSVTLTAPAGNFSVPTTTLMIAPADWITGRLTMIAITS